MSDFVNELVSMGFPQNRAEKAIFFTKRAGVQPALDWLLEHQDDPDIDEPITVDESQLAELTGRTTSTLSEEEKAKAVEALKARIAAKKAEKAKLAELDELEKEKQRREMGQKSGQTYLERKEAQERLEAARIKREKEAEKAYLAALKEKVRLEREERAGKTSASTAPITTSETSTSSSTPSTTTTSAPKPAVEHTECQLQIRLTNGQNIKNTFKPSDTIQAVAEWVSINRTDGFDSFVLMMNFPKFVFDTQEKMQMTLTEAKLVPRGALIVSKK